MKYLTIFTLVGMIAFGSFSFGGTDSVKEMGNSLKTARTAQIEKAMGY